MSTITKLKCDNCSFIGDKTSICELRIHTGFEPGPCHSESVYECLDLCVQCAGKALKRIMQSTAVEEAREFMREFKKEKSNDS